MTEDQAKTKWCPMIRTGMVAGMAVNHHVDTRPDGDGVYHNTRCIASECMMWRWNLEPAKEEILAIYVESTTDGRCGLAS